MKKIPRNNQIKQISLIETIKSEVMRDLIKKFINLNFSFSDDTYLICVQHILEDTLDMFRAFHVLGVPYHQIYVLGKEYSTVKKVADEMVDLGINVVSTENSDIGEFYKSHNANILKLWRKVGKQLSSKNKQKLLLISDGGELLTTIPKKILENNLVVGVEQTKSGLFHIQKNYLPIPVISVASSATKLYLETPIFIDSVIKRVSQYTNFDEDVVCGVVGLGAMGSALVRDLNRKGNKVYAFDQAVTSFAQNIDYTPAYSVNHLLTFCDYIFGCTGRDIFEDILFPFTHKKKLVLASLSSGDMEFLSLLKYVKKYSSIQKSALRNISFNTESGQIKILRQGHPINFNNLTGSAPMEITQLVTATLLASGVQAFRKLTKKSNDQGGQIVKVNPLVQKFIAKNWYKYIASNYPEYLDLYHKDIWQKAGSLTWLEANSGGIPETDLFISRNF